MKNHVSGEAVPTDTINTVSELCLANSKLGVIFEVSGGCHSPIAVFEKFIVASQG
jgi:hypothetical protein